MDDLPEELTNLYLEYHKAIVQQTKEERGSPPKPYKKMQLGWVRRLFQSIRLDGLTLIDQAMKILSGLVVCHALPNTNHRTSVFFVQAFLDANGVRFPHYRGRRSHQRRTRLDMNEYIRDSKYLLNLKIKQNHYVRRYQQGKRIMYFRGGGQRTIRAEDLGLSSGQYNRRHRKLTKKWLERMLGDQSARYLKMPADSLRRLLALSER